MLKLILGFAIWAGAQAAGLRPLWMILGFGVTALVVQVKYSHMLNDYLGGDAPVPTYGVRNLSELRRALPVPRPIVLLDTLAKALAYAALGGVFLWFGWV